MSKGRRRERKRRREATIRHAAGLRAIAAALNERGIPTASGAGEWQAVQVATPSAREPLGGPGAVASLRQVQTIRWSRHSAHQNTFSLTDRLTHVPTAGRS
jgi:hypothetical protein